MNQLNQHSSLLSVRFKTIIVAFFFFFTLHRFRDKRWNALMATSILESPLIDFVLFPSFQHLPLGVHSLLLVQCMTVANALNLKPPNKADALGRVALSSVKC